MLSITIKCNNEKKIYPKGVSLLEITKDFQKDFKEKIIVSRVDGSITELSTKLFNNALVEFYDRTSNIGNKVYESGLLFILIKAFKDIFDSDISINHSIDKGIYIKSSINLTEEKLEKLKVKMDEIIKGDLPIDKLLINRKEAMN